MKTIKAIVVSLSFLSPLGVCAAEAPYPNKSVRLIVPASPGGGLDIMARVMAQPLSAMWGQSVVVDNRPGAGVMLGTEMASKAVPDGYTLLMVNANLAPNAVLHEKQGVVKNLAAINLIAELPNAMSVPVSVPVSSVKELVALAKSSKMTYGTAGPATVGNILGEMFKMAIKADIVHVPYKGGGPVMVALAGGEVNMGIVSLASTMGHAKAGRVRILAVGSSQRSRLSPEIPTIAETVKGVQLESWVGLLAPAGTPPAIMKTVNAAVLKALEQAEVQKRLVGEGYDIRGGSAAEFDKVIRSDMVTYAKVMKEANIKAD